VPDERPVCGEPIGSIQRISGPMGHKPLNSI
jgi:hypothetical protein